MGGAKTAAAVLLDKTLGGRPQADTRGPAGAGDRPAGAVRVRGRRSRTGDCAFRAQCSIPRRGEMTRMPAGMQALATWGSIGEAEFVNSEWVALSHHQGGTHLLAAWSRSVNVGSHYPSP